MKVMVLHAHPEAARSRVNAALLAAARATPGITVRELYEDYPDFFIDVKREQALLEAHDVIVLQHPFRWYSVPALLKEWQDEVLTRGWAYGEGGTALHGKRWLQAVSTGGPAAAYAAGGSLGFTMRDLLAPLEATARLCGMRFMEPFLVHGTHRLTDEALRDHAAAYAALLAGLRDAPADDTGTASS